MERNKCSKCSGGGLLINNLCEKCRPRPETVHESCMQVIAKQGNDIKQLRADLDTEREHSRAYAHVIVEHGVVPGAADSCRCDECRHTVKGMAKAGYLDLVRDRWWEGKTETTEAAKG